MANWSTRLRCRRLIRAQGDRQSLQKSLNRSGAISVYLTVCWMFLCPYVGVGTQASCRSSSSEEATYDLWGIVSMSRPEGLPVTVSTWIGVFIAPRTTLTGY